MNYIHKDKIANDDDDDFSLTMFRLLAMWLFSGGLFSTIQTNNFCHVQFRTFIVRLRICKVRAQNM